MVCESRYARCSDALSDCADLTDGGDDFLVADLALFVTSDAVTLSSSSSSRMGV